MSLSELTAISPIDGRYHSKTNNLSDFFSEFALIKYRVRVEIEYFIYLINYLNDHASLKLNMHCKEDALREIYQNFTESDALEIKDIEQVTNHDVKAVEYFIKRRVEALGMEHLKEFIHFGLTSQDINNTAQPLMLKEALKMIIEPDLEAVLAEIKALAKAWKQVPMLAKTHGQAASPTTLGKEIYVFAYRIDCQLKSLYTTPHSAKFGGATGNFNAHNVAFPEKSGIDWNAFGDCFCETQLGLQREEFTTQISNYDNLAALFDNLKRICTILIDLCRDIWQYISVGYFKQKVVEGEVGSSAMPHKVNPIDFENAEGNCGIAVAILEHLSSKLPISRLQRDLTDSTVLRNMGVPLAHLEIAIKSLRKGLSKLMLNPDKIEEELSQSWAVVAEAIQTILRRENYPNPYETLKKLTRGNSDLNESIIHEFIDELAVSSELKNELKAIRPENYIGKCAKF